MSKKLILFASIFMILLTACKKDYTSENYLKSVLGALNKIESASYILTAEAWAPGDTAALFIYNSYYNEYKNPSDTTIGAKFVILDTLSRSKASFCYDGEMRASFYPEHKGIVIDSFTVRKLPFRPITPPFFNYVTNIIKYILTTEDSISLEMKEQKNDLFVRVTINEEEQVEFFGPAHHMPLSPYSADNTSIYELWIDKKTNLPYKIRREMSHDISVSTCKDVEFNQLDINDFKASDYFPADYIIKPYRLRKSGGQQNALLHKKAPDWTLLTADNKHVSLSDFKSNVFMIQFTSVNCGPCVASIPFLTKLKNEYKLTDFDFVAIECTSKNTNVLQSYMKRNKFDYTFLLSNKEVLNDYSIRSFPVFFILDKNREVKEVINGYGKESTDDKIRSVINKLINN